MATNGYTKDSLDGVYESVYEQELNRTGNKVRAKEAAQQAVRDYYMNGGVRPTEGYDDDDDGPRAA